MPAWRVSLSLMARSVPREPRLIPALTVESPGASIGRLGCARLDFGPPIGGTTPEEARTWA